MPYDRRIELATGDITALAVDAIVNAANRSLLGGGGVDGAIHRAAGAGLLAECQRLGGCETGEAKVTGGHALRARHVIHSVGPVWRGGTADEDRLLARCYRSALSLAVAHRLRSIAFPAISTGIYGFPRDRACAIAIDETHGFLLTDRTLERVIFISFDAETAALYRRRLGLG
jgi:O-acetyl-ADP-ribose deacetylase